jgi:tellurite resistance protein TerA
MPIDYSKRPAPTTGGQQGGAPVSLTKVTLTKDVPTVSLTKQGSATGQLVVNLNWNARPARAQRGRVLKRMAAAMQPGIDLDLGCLWELADGSVGVVQALGNSFGNYDRAPYVRLDGDDRTGAVADGENLRVNLAHATQIRRLLVFAWIYEGIASFDQADGVVTLTPASGPPIEVRLDERAGSARMCAIALLENSGGDLSVRREVRYINGSQEDLDRAYGWGMQWRPGRK